MWSESVISNEVSEWYVRLTSASTDLSLVQVRNCCFDVVIVKQCKLLSFGEFVLHENKTASMEMSK